MDIVSTKMTNTVSRNITSTASVNCHSKKVKNYYILHTVLLVIILLIIITIICCHYAKQKGTINGKWWILKKFILKIVCVIWWHN